MSATPMMTTMTARLCRLLYQALWIPALPAVLLRLCWRARRQRGYLRHLAERFGGYSARPASPVLWVHAVSVGETRAAEPLIRSLLQRWPSHSIVLSHMTPTGRETSRALFENEPRITRIYLPYDLGFAAERFLRHFRPQAGVIMETELWPTLLHRCARHDIPVIIANARLSERSARRYGRLPAFAGLLLTTPVIAAQTEDDARRFCALGARRVSVTGNIKFDIEPPAPMLELGRRFRAGIGCRPVLLAASTRDGEEALLLDAFAAQADPAVLLVVVPRHPQRFEEVARLALSRGLSVQRRSDGQAIADTTRIWLGDSMGEMFAYYAAADVAMIGGNWLPFGGQNLIESCAVGTPVVVGPHTFNFARVTEEAIASGAALRVTDAAEGMRQALALLNAPDERQRRSEAARQFAAAHRGATERTIELLARSSAKLPA